LLKRRNISILILSLTGWILSEGDVFGESGGKVDRRDFSERYCDAQISGLKRRLSLSSQQTRQVRQILSGEDWRSFLAIAGRLETFDSSMRAIYASGKSADPGEVQKAVRELSPLCRQGLTMLIRRSKRIEDLLTPRQRAIYGPEVREIEVNAAELTERLCRWEQGRFHSGELQKCFGKKIDSSEAISDDFSDKTYTMTSIDFWDLYVQTFVEAFGLDRGQRTMAYSLLSEIKLEAQRYMADHQAEYSSIERTLASFNKDSADQSTAYGELLLKKEKLDRVILDMFDRLRERLMAIPTQDQIKSAVRVLNAQETVGRVKTTTQPVH